MAIEKELKFVITNAGVRETLVRLDAFGDFRMGPGKLVKVVDHYYDTTDGRVASNGFALRIRQDDERRTICLKALGATRDAMHVREEIEQPHDADGLQPMDRGAVRDRLESMVAVSDLDEIVVIRQRRLKRDVSRGEGIIAEWSFDDVVFEVGDTRYDHTELEIELVGTDDEAILEEIGRILQDQFGLQPAFQSKYETALQLRD